MIDIYDLVAILIASVIILSALSRAYIRLRSRMNLYKKFFEAVNAPIDKDSPAHEEIHRETYIPRKEERN